MDKTINESDIAQGGDTQTNVTVTCTQIASCAVSNYASEPMRLSLRAKLEREQRECELANNGSLYSRIRNLFSPATS